MSAACSLKLSEGKLGFLFYFGQHYLESTEHCSHQLTISVIVFKGLNWNR